VCCKGNEGDQREPGFPGKDALKCSTNNNGVNISLSNRDGADTPPRRSVEDSTAKRPPMRPTQ